MIQRNWCKVGLVILMVVFWGFVSPLSAQEPEKGNIKIGALEVHPSVGLSGTYNDNIYKNFGNLKSEADYITTLSPGIQFFLPIQRHNLQLGYQADINWYKNNSDTNYFNQQASGALNLNFTGGLTVNVSDLYSDTTVPRRGKSTPGVSGAADTYHEMPYISNDFNFLAKYQFVDRWAIEGRYNNFDYGYKNRYDEAGSYKRNRFGGSLYYRFTAKIDALVDYNYAQNDYKINGPANNNKVQGTYVGLSFDPTSRMRGFLKLGWGQKDYDNNIVAGRNTSFSFFSSLVDLTYTLSRYDRFNLRANRTAEDDVLTQAPFINTDIFLGYNHIFSWNEKVSFNDNLGYGSMAFEGSTTDIDGAIKIRDDKRFSGGLGVGYALQRWLNLGLNYSYTNNDSNMLNYKYTENKVWVNATAAF